MSYHRYSPELVKSFLKRLEGTEGKVDVAARSLSIPPVTIRTWRLRHPEFDEQCREVIERVRTIEVTK